MKFALLTLAMTLLFSVAQAAESTPPDNSAVNERDRASASVTATDQSTSGRDTQITAEIRKALMADDTLSMYAHNVKIITINGKVTLKGPVKSEHERQEVYRHAARVASGAHISNQMEVAKGE